ERGGGAHLATAQPAHPDEYPGIDFHHQAAPRLGRVHRPDRHLAVQSVEQSHPGKAGFGDLGGADRVVERRGLAAAALVEGMFADPVMEKIALRAVGGAEIEMAAMNLFEKARRAEILVRRLFLDIGPEALRLP